MTDSFSETAVRDQISLITQNLQEVLNGEIIEDVMLKQRRSLVLYWGTATTGRPHCGYFVPMLKIAQFLAAGCTVKILLADIHAMLDNDKAPIDLVKFRAEYYKFVISGLLSAVHVPLDRLEFVLGSTYQLSSEYTLDLFRLSRLTTEHDAKKAASEVVKQGENPSLSGLIYPLMQALDEEYLGVDAQFGGVDQRKIFALAKDALPKIGYRERAHLMNPMVPGLQGGKMSSSDQNSKINLLDPPDIVRNKLRKAVAAPRIIEGNGIISFTEYVLLPASALCNNGQPHFVVPRTAQANSDPNSLSDLVYTSAEQLKSDYANDILTPQLLKGAVCEALNRLLEPIRADFAANPRWQELEKIAYPDEGTHVEKPKKKVKDKGTRFPGKSPLKSHLAFTSTPDSDSVNPAVTP